MAVEAYSQRSLQPFDGVIQALECHAGRALSLDGKTWHLQLSLELTSAPWSAFGTPTLKHSFVPYGNWSREKGISRLPLSPLADAALAREQAEEILSNLQPALDDFPFPPGDPFELWLLDPSDQLPLALLGNARTKPDRSHRPAYRWKAFPLHQDPLLVAQIPDGQPPLASRVESLVNRRGGSSPTVQWFLRRSDGSGQGLQGWHLEPALEQRVLPAAAFPAHLLREAWPDPDQYALVRRYQERIAPRLLTLATAGTEGRRLLEALAWQQPELVSRLHRQYPLVLDRDGLKVTLIKARMMLSGARA